MLPQEVARMPLGTPAGEFDLRAFRCSSGFVYLALQAGDIGDGAAVLTRLHSECLTGDALGSLRCDCGMQLRVGLRSIAAEGRGVLMYATGQEGRGIGLINKLRAYVLQDGGLDTVEANSALGLPVEARDYADAANVLRAIGVRSVRLLTNNPDKVRELEAHGVAVETVLPIPTAAHHRNRTYLRTKMASLGHVTPAGRTLPAAAPVDAAADVVDVGTLLGEVRPRSDRPYVVLKYAQTLDGRIATTTGESKWISGEPERVVSHALRAACDAVMVGSGTVAADDPHLTVRLVPGASPIRVVLDSTLRLPFDANVMDGGASTIVVTSRLADPRRRNALRGRGVAVRIVPPGPAGVDLAETLRVLRLGGVRSLLVEGGARVITALLAERLVDRVIISIAPMVMGSGTEAIGDLGISHVRDALTVRRRTMTAVGDDVVVAGDVVGSPEHRAPAAADGQAAQKPGNT